MDSAYPHHNHPKRFTQWFYERLRSISDVTWDESRPPLQSSYEDIYTIGTWKPAPLPHANDTHSPSRSNFSTHFGSRPPSPPTDQDGPDDAAAEESNLQPRIISARISRHRLRLERQYQALKTDWEKLDPQADHHIRALKLYRLPPRTPNEPELAVILYERLGASYLREYISYGPGCFDVSETRHSQHWDPRMSASGKRKTGEISLRTFLEFAIGACSCCELLPRTSQGVHGELRGDSFHFDKETRSVRLINVGSGTQSVESGLTSSGWSSLSREPGVEYKLQFISPEQTGRVQARPDTRTDIYSLGIVFWNLLTGELPFQGSTPLEVMQHVVGRRVASVSSKRLDVPDALSHAISKMVQKNIEDRYHSMNGLKWDLEQIQYFLREGDSDSLREFKVGSRDVNSYFVLPNVCTGRNQERQVLVDIINRATAPRQRGSQVISPSKALTPVSSNSSFSEQRPGSMSENASNRDSVVLENTLQGQTDGQDQLASLPEASDGISTQDGSTENSISLQGQRLSTDASFSINSADLPFRGSPRPSVIDSSSSALRRSSISKYKRKGRCEVVTIQGSAGNGKSSLVQSVAAEVRNRGFFATSKFDQTKRLPFEPVQRLLSSLFRQAFTEPDVNTTFHNSLKSFVRPVWGVLHNMLSLPEWLLENSQVPNDLPALTKTSSPSTHNLSRPASRPIAAVTQTKCGSAGQTTADFLRTGASFKSSRFIAIYLDVLRFIASFRGVTFCLEDLQFADEESLELIQGIILSRAQIILILTFRDEGQLSSTLQPLLHSRSAKVTSITLNALSEDDIADYVSATLHRTPTYCLPLTAVILEKTQGNPFFMREILETCYRKECIWYSWDDSSWHYDLDKVFSEFESTQYGSQISNDYLVARFKDLSPSTRMLLAFASLLGSPFSFSLVKVLMQSMQNDSQRRIPDGNELIEEAISPKSIRPPKVDLVRQLSLTALQGLQGAIAAVVIYPEGGADEDKYCFVHDRYLQAACVLTECHDVAEMHYRISTALVSDQFRNDYCSYTKSAHIGKSLNIIKERIPVRAPYRDILFEAAEQATESGGRTAGLQYFRDCLFLLQDKAWGDDVEDASYQETLTLMTKTAECYFFKGYLDKALDLLHSIYEKARNTLDKVPAYILKGRILARRGDQRSSWKILRQCLDLLGLEFKERTMAQCNEQFRTLCKKVEDADREAFVSQPSNEDDRLQAIASVLAEAMAAAFWSDTVLYYNLVFVEVEFLLANGMIAQLAGAAFVHLAAIAIGRFEMVEFGWEVGNIAQGLFEKFKDDAFSYARGQTLYCMLVGAFGTPTRNLLPAMERAMDTAMSGGDRFSALLVGGHLAASKLWCSHDLLDVEAFCTYAAEELFHWREDFRGGLFMTAVKQFSRALMGKTDTRDPNLVMTDSEHDSVTYLELVRSRSSNPARSLTLYKIYLLQTLFMFGHYESAVQLGEEIQAANVEYWSSRFSLLKRFYLSLSYMAVLREAPNRSDQASLHDYVRLTRSTIHKWCAVNDVNFACYEHILAAELYEFDGKYDGTLQSYEAAQDHAELHNMAFEQALASELYAEFMIRRGVKRPAGSNLRDAITLYESMSAHGKAEQIATKHEWLLKGTSTLHLIDAGTQTITEPTTVRNGRNDKAASRVFSQHFDLSDPHRLSEALTDKSQAQSTIDSIGLDILDLTSILQSSQVLSSELDVDRLLSKMTSIILSSTGGNLAAIVVGDDDEKVGWNVAAISDAEGREFPAGQPLDNVSDMVSKQITLYALRFRETVFLDNVLEDDRFSGVTANYRSRNPDGKAVICLPLVRDLAVLGAVYLEGPVGSFTERNVHVLRLLAHSISISITNAKLFKKLEKVSASNAVMIQSQKHALEQARESERKAKESERKALESEQKAKAAENEAMRSVRQKEEAVAAKTTFLANTSHELRTPLNGVIGMSELLKGSKLTKEQEGFADSIRVCADTLLTVINDILDFSKLEAGKMQIFSVPLSLNETIREVVRALAFSMRSDLQTIVDLSLDESLLVMGDPVRLHQILMNLLSNAYKFTQTGHVKVSAVADRETEDEVQVTCSVSDTGVGISEEQKKKLFLPFSQADSSTARSYGGTGLGLSICKAIIENVLRGKIWLQSEPDIGTTVFFRLTFKKVSSQTDTTHLGAPKSKDTDPMAIYSPEANGGKDGYPFWNQNNLQSIPRDQLRCAIAEDNPINQKIAKTFVQKLGLKCEAFPDGRQAVDAIVDASMVGKPFHLVLMDVQMPVLDGYNATREIRQCSDPAVKNVLIIAMTASAIRGDREKCLEAGMNNYLAKPVRQQVLKQMLDGYIRSDTQLVPDARRDSPSLVVDGNGGGSSKRVSTRQLPGSA